MGNTLEIILTIIAMSFWILFPIGMFLSVSRVDKNTDQIIRLEHHEQYSMPEFKTRARPVVRHFDWHHPILYFRNWLHYE
ncbi:hypothetical protein [Peredibacter starrii]|uniref:Uncharacterized protein n=1 Tax=Peredibacter starrii TaxID=28202 RepID=A0AAX4HU47_9BACT|nr:hypothetical protein [Peredibacter starrii]WPU66921.1 hypothetical protein SOO65_09180 [Peredibacter starrii]